ncbi:MAG: type IV secretion system protein [Rickettsiaceae bacterium]|nr:type IV secretion system protein [Rickettsiaceae bacterium]
MLKTYKLFLLSLVLSYFNNIIIASGSTSSDTTNTSSNTTISSTDSDGTTTTSTVDLTTSPSTGGLGSITDLINNAPSPLNEILQGIIDLTCETSAFVNITLRYEYTNTCLPSPLFTQYISSIFSPYFYQVFLRRLHIDDDTILPGNCDFINRADPYDPKITFGICSNVKLFAERIEGFAEGIYNLAKGFITGNFSKVSQSFLTFINPKNFHVIYKDKAVGDEGVFLDVGLEGVDPYPVVLPWKVVRRQDAICVSTISFTGWMTVGCKYMFEPMPESIYQNIAYSSPSSETSTNSSSYTLGANEKKSIALMQCSNAVGCFEAVKSNSFALSKITSIVVSCVNSMLVKMLVNESACTISDVASVMSTSSLKVNSVIYQFQDNMRGFIQGFLILYIAFFGISLMLGKNFNQKEMIIALIKIVLVTYFTLGIGGLVNGVRVDGMTSLIFPLLLTVPSEIAGWISNSTSSGLCDFSDMTYAKGYEYLQLWDSLDCKIGHYIGFDMISEFYADNFSTQKDWKQFANISFPVPPYIYLIAAGFYSGMTQLIIIALMYPILVISMAAYVLQFFVVSMIMMTILGILSPIFIPLALFRFSYSYFTNWLRLFISFGIQPMIVVAFVTVAFAVFDRGLYGTCKFTSSYATGTYYKKALAFSLDDDKKDYTTQDYNTCVDSLGYMLQNPLSFALTTLTKTLGAIFTGTFPIVIFDAIKNILLNMIVAIFTIYLIYQLSGQLAEFSAGLAMSISIGGLVSSIQNNYSTLTKLTSTLASLAGKTGSLGKGNMGGMNMLGSSKSTSSFSNELKAIGFDPNETANLGVAKYGPNSSSSNSSAATTPPKPLKGSLQLKFLGTTVAKFDFDQSKVTSSSTDLVTPNAQVDNNFRANTANTAPESSKGSVQFTFLGVKVTQIDFGKSKAATSDSIRATIEKFHADKGINLFKNQGELLEKGREGEKNVQFSYIEFSRYIANIDKAESDSNDEASAAKAEKFKNTYATTFGRYLSDNKFTHEHADEFALRLEASLGGSSAKVLRDINDRILADLGIKRTKTLADIAESDDTKDTVGDSSDVNNTGVIAAPTTNSSSLSSKAFTKDGAVTETTPVASNSSSKQTKDEIFSPKSTKAIEEID